MRILIIEDERRIAQTLKKGFEEERFVVDVAHNGIVGYDLASSEEYGVLIVDRMLPGMDGIALCKRLRHESITTPLLLLTAKSMIQDKVEGLDAGADDYMPKPFSFEELLARVRALSRRSKILTKTILHIGTLHINPQTYSVVRSGRIINLTKKEYVLLLFLAEHAGKIVTKDQIMQHVWEYDADILTNTVEVFINKLRKKIDTPFPNENQLLHTVRGFGYKLEEKNV